MSLWRLVSEAVEAVEQLADAQAVEKLGLEAEASLQFDLAAGKLDGVAEQFKRLADGCRARTGSRS